MSPISIAEQKGTVKIGYIGSAPSDQIVASDKMISLPSIQTTLVDKSVIGTNIVAAEFMFYILNIKNIALGDNHEVQQLAFNVLGASNLKMKLV